MEKSPPPLGFGLLQRLIDGVARRLAAEDLVGALGDLGDRRPRGVRGAEDRGFLKETEKGGRGLSFGTQILCHSLVPQLNS